jgi:hypothetical protein
MLLFAAFSDFEPVIPTYFFKLWQTLRIQKTFNYSDIFDEFNLKIKEW